MDPVTHVEWRSDEKRRKDAHGFNGEFQVIIDNMMNLELLFWASKHGGSPDLYDIAVSHANRTIENHLRGDGSSFHVVVYDTATGKVKEKRTARGLSAGSDWARGQAWGLYGFTLCFRETRDSTYLQTAINYLSAGTKSSGILIHCAYNVNRRNPDDWDASTIWGDYYFLEALYRYQNRAAVPSVKGIER
jgi:hypothetical protein